MSSLIYRLNHAGQQASSKLFGHTFDPNKDIVLVTGGSSGLGHEIVKMYNEQGAVVVVLDVQLPRDKVDGVFYYTCDVSDKEQILQVSQQIKQEVGFVTILVNNAGITSGKTLLELSFEDIDRIIQINLLSSFYTIKVFLPDMVAIKRGYIVTVASALGYISPARLSAYGASKSGLIAMHESLTYELGQLTFNAKGIKMLLICPGQLKTKMFLGVQTPSSMLAPELDPKYVALRIFNATRLGQKGEIKLPFYANFLPVLRAAPWPLVAIIREVSGIDKSMHAFKKLTSRANSALTSISSAI